MRGDGRSASDGTTRITHGAESALRRLLMNRSAVTISIRVNLRATDRFGSRSASGGLFLKVERAFLMKRHTVASINLGSRESPAVPRESLYTFSPSYSSRGFDVYTIEKRSKSTVEVTVFSLGIYY